MVLVSSVRIPRVPTYSGYCFASTRFRLRGCHPLCPTFQGSSAICLLLLPQSLPQAYFYPWFGLFRVRSPLLTESFLLSFPPGTKMFQFPGFPSHTLCVQVWIIRCYAYWVPSFGYLRISGYLLLPAAFRSLSRPSSAPRTKASTSMLFVAWSFFFFSSLIAFSSLSLWVLSVYFPYKKFYNFNSTNFFSYSSEAAFL